MMFIGIQVLLSMSLALIFLSSAIPKLRHPKGFILAVLEYRVLPTRVGWLYGRLLPPLELLLVLLLLSGTAVRSVAIVLALLLLSFMIAISINLARGRDLDCHCFGKTRRRTIGWGLVLQDSALLVAAIVLAVIPGTWIEAEPWSIFHLFGFVPAGTSILLLCCAGLIAFATALLSRSTFGKRRYGNGVVKK